MTTATANKVKAPKKGFKLDRQMIPTLAAVVIFILMIIMGQALFGTYIRLGFISSLFIDHAYLIILAVAMTLPILTGGIDLSVGAIVAITAVVGLKLANAGVPAFLVMIIMLLIGAVFGLLAGTLIEEFNMQPFIATLSTMFLARGLASIISTDSLTFPQGNDFSFISNVIKIIDNPKISNDLSFNVGVIIALVVVVFGYVFLHHTRTGRTIYAIGGSRSSAELMGLPVKRTLDLCDSRRPGLDRVHRKHRLCQEHCGCWLGARRRCLRGHRRYDHHRWLRLRARLRARLSGPLHPRSAHL